MHKELSARVAQPVCADCLYPTVEPPYLKGVSNFFKLVRIARRTTDISIHPHTGADCIQEAAGEMKRVTRYAMIVSVHNISLNEQCPV